MTKEIEDYKLIPMSEITPGPWSYESTNGWLWIWGARKQKIIMSVSSGSGLGGGVLAENEANARLIAQAPAMYELLAEIFEEVGLPEPQLSKYRALIAALNNSNTKQ